MMRMTRRYQPGRSIAAGFALLGWIGVVVAVLAFVLGAIQRAPGAGADAVVLLAGSFTAILLGQIARAVFDLAEAGLLQASD